jgi:hypothetical protein
MVSPGFLPRDEMGPWSVLKTLPAEEGLNEITA